MFFFSMSETYKASLCSNIEPFGRPFDSDARSQNSQATDSVRTFLNAQAIRSNPFLPWSMDGSRKLSSTTVCISK